MARDVEVVLYPGYSDEMLAGAILVVVSYMGGCANTTDIIESVRNLLGGGAGEERIMRAVRLLEERGYVRVSWERRPARVCMAR